MTISPGRYGDPASDTSATRTPNDQTVTGAVKQAGEHMSAMADNAQHAAHQQLDKLADTIRRNPLQATGVAAGIGFVLALIARR